MGCLRLLSFKWALISHSLLIQKTKGVMSFRQALRESNSGKVYWGKRSEPLPSHPNVDFVCVYVCMYVCHRLARYLFLILTISTNFMAHVL